MESPTSICDAEIPLQIRNIDAFYASYAKSLQTLRATAQQTAQYQVQLEEIKVKSREAEDDLVKALAVKTRKEAKRMALMDAIASAKARVEDLNTSIQEQRTKKQEYAAFLSQQSSALTAFEGSLNESIEHKDETQEAISWYNRVLGFYVKGGRGVKFTFKNINLNNPNEEFFFTICHESNSYTLLICEPFLSDIKELINELNRTNGLFKFVRVMRKKFQAAVAQGSLILTTVEHEESAFISTSAPILSVSYVRSDSPTKENEHRSEPTEGNTQFKKQNVRRRVKSAVLSPGSASSVRQSPRLKARQ
ncbi:kinetochore protein SPC25 homolog isoform X2 [Gastrolobium bilobum]|uniref:kinetochore protein SPC25 homolog isoform X2 n=1 Tax=Gastrolobium bilobum TaxID=150636 RepID=UPI002AB30214|nr:kinetochore protein SPC25 homolog isoform X2 [Gastrolobium bilobum]